MVKTRNIKVKSIANEEIIMTMTMTKTIMTKIIITIRIRMRIEIGNNKDIKTLKQNEKCSSKSNSYLLKREKRTESHFLLERGNHLL